MLTRYNISAFIFTIFNISFLILISLLTLYPMIYVLFASISDAKLFASFHGLLLTPQGFSVDAYIRVLKNPNIYSGYRNTVINLSAGVCLNLLLTSFGAYTLCAKTLYMRGAFTFFVAFTMFFSGGMIPMYIQVYNLGLVNTRWALIFPVAINTWNMIVMRTGFQAIPDSIYESVRLDGANDFQILFKITLPLSLPVVAVMVLFYGVHHWNSWFNAMLYINNRSLFPLQLILREILITNTMGDMGMNTAMADAEPVAATIRFATIIVSTVPILFIYPFLQRYFVKGIMVGAIKG
jgi:putative aldouronate transport system permease protein